MAGCVGRDIALAGGRGTLPPRDDGENPPPSRAGAGCEARGPLLIADGGRGTLRAICILFPRSISPLFMAGRCMLLFGVADRCMVWLPGRGTPRMLGEGTPLLRAFSAPGIMREGVIGPLDARAGPPILPVRAAGDP